MRRHANGPTRPTLNTRTHFATRYRALSRHHPPPLPPPLRPTKQNGRRRDQKSRKCKSQVTGDCLASPKRHNHSHFVHSLSSFPFPFLPCLPPDPSPTIPVPTSTGSESDTIRSESSVQNICRGAVWNIREVRRRVPDPIG